MLEVLQLMRELTARVIINMKPNFPCISFHSPALSDLQYFRMPVTK